MPAKSYLSFAAFIKSEKDGLSLPTFKKFPAALFTIRTSFLSSIIITPSARLPISETSLPFSVSNTSSSLETALEAWAVISYKSVISASEYKFGLTEEILIKPITLLLTKRGMLKKESGGFGLV